MLAKVIPWFPFFGATKHMYIVQSESKLKYVLHTTYNSYNWDTRTIRFMLF